MGLKEILALSTLFTCFLISPPGSAQGSPSQGRDETFIEEKIRWFRKQAPARRAALLKTLRAAAEKVEDPYLAQLRAWAKKAVPGKPRLAPLRKKKKKKKRRKASERPIPRFDPFQELPFPYKVRYVFGQGIIQSFRPNWLKWKPRSKGGKALKAKLALQEEVKEFRALLAGYPPYLDRSLAGLLRFLDQDRSMDRLANFLETYNQDAYSFYQAMDSASREGEDLFYFDSMLLAWIQYCYKNKPKLQKELRKKSMPELRRLLFRSFASYRRYRGLREAIVLSLSLAPEDPFPEHLERYDPKRPGNQYFTRDECLMLLALNHFQIQPFLRGLRASLPPMEFPLFENENRQVEAVNAAFEKGKDQITDSRMSTDQFLKKAKETLRASFAKVAAKVSSLLEAHSK